MPTIQVSTMKSMIVQYTSRSEQHRYVKNQAKVGVCIAPFPVDEKAKLARAGRTHDLLPKMPASTEQANSCLARPLCIFLEKMN